MNNDIAVYVNMLNGSERVVDIGSYYSKYNTGNQIRRVNY